MLLSSTAAGRNLKLPPMLFLRTGAIIIKRSSSCCSRGRQTQIRLLPTLTSKWTCCSSSVLSTLSYNSQKYYTQHSGYSTAATATAIPRSNSQWGNTNANSNANANAIINRNAGGWILSAIGTITALVYGSVVSLQQKEEEKEEQEEDVNVRNEVKKKNSYYYSSYSGMICKYMNMITLSPSSSTTYCETIANTNTKHNTPASKNQTSEQDDNDNDNGYTTVINWSGTHTVHVPNTNYHEPESMSELQSIVQQAYLTNTNLRPSGSALSPNAISFSPQGMIRLTNLDSILHVNTHTMEVTVQAGARISQVLEELRNYHLTLPNLASISEQQMGGFIQIGAHGTGASLSPADDYVTRLTIVTPSPHGTITLSKHDDGELFDLAKVGLGCLGIVSDVTIQCVPAHNLLEHTFCLTRKEAKKQLNDLLQKHKHVRYMWIPYQDVVVVVTNDPVDDNDQDKLNNGQDTTKIVPSSHNQDPLYPLKSLLLHLSSSNSNNNNNNDNNNNDDNKYTLTSLQNKGFGDLRDELLAIDPLNGHHIQLVNKAEAEFWKLNQGYQIKPSDELLQFDCGGQQWVYEVCFPTGTYTQNDGSDIQFMFDLLHEIETNNIPAPAPIEQRWSASSSSLMSPAYSPNKNDLFCWVGIIMYLPSDDEAIRQKITHQFKTQYCNIVRQIGGSKIATHWGKLEIPNSYNDYLMLRDGMKRRYPLDKFNAARMLYDPKNLLANDLMNLVLGRPH